MKILISIFFILTLSQKVLSIEIINKKNINLEYEIAMGSISNIPQKIFRNVTKPKNVNKLSGNTLSKTKNYSDGIAGAVKNLDDEIIINPTRKSSKIKSGQLDDFGITTSSLAVGVGVKEIFEKEYESYKEMSEWECPDSVKNNPLLKDLSENDRCVAYQMSCNVKIEKYIHILNEDKTGLNVRLDTTGSGFFINPNTIITNYHVVEGSFVSDIRALPFTTYLTYSLNILAYDQVNDFALLKFNSDNKFLHFPSCKLSNTNPEINSNVIAIGSPDYRKFDLTKGTLEKYLSKEFNETTDSNLFHWIQMNASINYGSSGGPLYSKRNVIGINTGSYDDNFISIHYDKLKKFLEKNNVENYGFYMRNIVDGKKIIEFYDYFEKEIN